VTETVVAALAGLFGLAVGSFLNVCIYRLPRGESLAWPGSRCPACRQPIRWHDNVPVFGWLSLHGRCRQCAAPIALTYPVVELITGLLFAAHVWAFGWQPLLVPRLLFACAMVVLFAIDFEHQLLPNAVTYPGIVAGLAFSLVFPPGWKDAVLGLILGGGSLWLLAEAWYRLRKVEGLGGGDIKMLAMIGAFLGWQQVLLTLVLSSFVGSIVGGLLIASRRGTLASKLPYGTFLAMAAVVASLVGQRLVAWYVSLYR